MTPIVLSGENGPVVLLYVYVALEPRCTFVRGYSAAIENLMLRGIVWQHDPILYSGAVGTCVVYVAYRLNPATGYVYWCLSLRA